MDKNNNDKAEKKDDDFPESFLCPLTQEVMKDPVVDTEGNSYERAAIESWLEKNKTSPITRKPLQLTDLAPNRALRDVIAEHYKKKVDELLAHRCIFIHFIAFYYRVSLLLKLQRNLLLQLQLLHNSLMSSSRSPLVL